MPVDETLSPYQDSLASKAVCRPGVEHSESCAKDSPLIWREWLSRRTDVISDLNYLSLMHAQKANCHNQGHLGIAILWD